jgi:uncharacterized membrane protein YccC
VAEGQIAHLGIRGGRSWLIFTSTGDLEFALRTAVTGIAALYTAMWLQLDVPRWAILTVVVVSPPVRGNALRKTGARLVGTAIGCIAALVCASLFPQQPAGFYLVFSAWMGACAYWATLRRGYMSYAAILAAFTSAIIASDVSSAPQDMWRAALDRGAETVIGTLFAFIASQGLAKSDNVQSEFVHRISILAGDLIDWAARQLDLGASGEPKDAPCTEKILGLDEVCTNAIAERPALEWVKPWIQGLPTALLSLQSAALRTRDPASRGKMTEAGPRLQTNALRELAAFLRSSAVSDVPSLRRESAAWAELRNASWARASGPDEIIDPLLYLLTSLEAILTLHPPDRAAPMYPRPKFPTHRRSAIINLARTVVGLLCGYFIWDATAWPHGPTFVTLDDPVSGNWQNLIGNTIGALVALAAKYLMLVRTSDPFCLVLVLFSLIFVGVWAETKPKLASLGIFFVNGLLIVLEPTNPQQYDFVQDINVLTALVFAYAFVSLIFLMIGAPRKGRERIAELLLLMRRRLRRFQPHPGPIRQQRLRLETQLYDELQRLHAVTNDPGHRERAVNVLLANVSEAESDTPSPAALAAK